jgi:nucleoside 2-deoxyribosyltransferase
MTTNRVFLACNYSNKKVKGHFNKLKERLQKEWPIHVILIDKERGNASKDFWKQIRAEIDNCALAIFDVSAFRPNVVLELGYALAIKDEKQILITFDQRKPRTAKPPEWLLTDISHIHQVRYRQIEQMDDKIEENLESVPAVAAFKSLCDEAKSTSIPDKYKIEALKVLHKLQDGVNGLTDQQFDGVIKGRGVNRQTLATLLKRHKLATRERGRGRWHLVT